MGVQNALETVDDLRADESLSKRHQLGLPLLLHGNSQVLEGKDQLRVDHPDPSPFGNLVLQLQQLLLVSLALLDRFPPLLSHDGLSHFSL